MELSHYLSLRQAVIDAGFAYDITWAQNVGAPASAEVFASEFIFVVCNSGMKAQIARAIFERVKAALLAGVDPASVFGHKGKVGAIAHVWRERDAWFERYNAAIDKVEFLGDMPWIGPITKWHLAKNFGVNAVKPDRHLVRVADYYATTPDELCQTLARGSGERVGTVDYVIWRACNLGLIRHDKAADAVA